MPRQALVRRPKLVPVLPIMKPVRSIRSSGTPLSLKRRTMWSV